MNRAASALALALAGSAAALHRASPVLRPASLENIYGSLASVEKSDFEAIQQIFALAQKQVNLARANVTRVNATKVGAPAAAGAPAGPSRGPEGGDRIPATGPAYTPPAHLAALDPAMKATAEPLFVPLCAAKIEEMVEKNAAYLAKFGASNDTIGLSLATHFQVVCEGAFPVKEQQCDDTSEQLAQLVDSGKPLNPPVAGPAGAPGAPAAALA